MAEYIEQGYTEPNYIEGDEMSPTVATCDLTSLQTDFNEIDLSLLSIDEKVDSLVARVYNLTSIVEAIGAQISNLYLYGVRKSDLTSLSINVDLSILATKTDIQNLSNDIDNIVLPSLNGRGCEHLDGAMVTVLGRSDIVYSVERSFVSLYSDNGYTVHYDLIATSGHKVTVPEALLTKYVSTVV